MPVLDLVYQGQIATKYAADCLCTFAPQRYCFLAWAQPGYLYQSDSISYWGFSPLTVDAEFITFCDKLIVSLLDTRKCLYSIPSFLLCHKTNNVVHRPFLRGLVYLDAAISQIGINEAHGANCTMHIFLLNSKRMWQGLIFLLIL